METNSGSFDGDFMNRSEDDTNLTDKEICAGKPKTIFEDTEIVDQQANLPKYSGTVSIQRPLHHLKRSLKERGNLLLIQIDW